jgi:hypothetical protein
LAGRSFWAITFDVSRGAIRRAFYTPSRASGPAVTKETLKKPINQKMQYVKTRVGAEYDFIPAKGLNEIVSILDIYRRALESVADLKGEIVELSFFSHAYSDGPILTNTYEFQRVVGDGSSATLAPMQVLAGSVRDPNDLDPRKQDFDAGSDLMPGVQSEEALKAWHSIFAESGRSWIWGCSRDDTMMQLVRGAGRSTPKLGRFLKPEQNIKVPLRKFDADRIATVHAGLLHATASPTVFEINVGELRGYVRGRLGNTYAQRLANATSRPVYAAAPGTYAGFKSGTELYVPSAVRDVIEVYRSGFGREIDPEGNNYIKYVPA